MKYATSDEVGASVTGVGGCGCIECFERQLRLALPDLNLGQSGEGRGRVGVGCNSAVGLLRRLRQFVFMKKCLNKPGGEERIVGLLRQGLHVELLGFRILAVAVGFSAGVSEWGATAEQAGLWP